MKDTTGRNLPDFVVIGGMKCGTTALFRYLKQHPDIFVPKKKNIEFFSETPLWDKGIDWYSSFYSGSTHCQRVVGEVSTEYTKYPFDHEGPAVRMARVLPNARIVYLVRHPIKRMISQYIHLINELREFRDLNDAICDPSYLNPSLYHYQLSQFVEHFPLDHILVLSSEDLKSDRQGTLNRLFCFIGVREYEIQVSIEANTQDEKRRWNYMGRWLKDSQRRFGVYQYYVGRIPHPVADFVRACVSSPIIVPPLASEVRDILSQKLSEDLEGFYKLAGEGFPNWDI